MKKNDARTLALDLLLRSEAAGQYANIALDTALSRGRLEDADRAFATTLFYGVLERRLTLDHIIAQNSALPAGKIEPRVREILRLALFQLLYLDRVPDHAAIFEAVEEAPPRSKSFVNALLRSFCRKGKNVEYPAKETDIAAFLSVRYSIDRALAAALLSAYGAEKTKAILAAFEDRPPVTVRVNTARLTRAEFLSRYGGTPTKNAPFGVRLAEKTPLFSLLDAGVCFVEDEASQIAVEVLDARAGTRVRDLCAAPGSKTFGIALSGATVVASDLHENKLSLIRRGAETLGLSGITVTAADAREARGETFDRVLADVPCSGYGVIGKKPDIRYKSPAGREGLLRTQAEILSAAADITKPGGVLVYSTCTLLPDENEGQIAAFLTRRPDFALAPFRVGDIAANGAYTFFPDTDKTDGFFVAKLMKKGT